MKRRDFIAALGGAAAMPLVARAQERVRRVGVLIGAAVAGMDDPDSRARVTAFQQALQQLGWTEGRNVRIDHRWATGSADDILKNAKELVELGPDVILTTGSAVMTRLIQATRTVPIVFTSVTDPVGAGFVESLAQPGGNVTGFMQFEYSLSGKWLELLKEIAPNATRAAVLRDAAISAGSGQFAVIQAVAPSVGMDIMPINVRDAGEIERAIANFARTPNGGLIATASALTVAHRKLIIALAARHRLPAVYYRRLFVDDGGLISYGPNILDASRQAAGYVDRILRGDKPADLPVQAPNRYETVVNLKSAKALGLTVPPSVLARADEVIE